MITRGVMTRSKYAKAHNEVTPICVSESVHSRHTNTAVAQRGPWTRVVWTGYDTEAWLTLYRVHQVGRGKVHLLIYANNSLNLQFY